jgi:uncharacterized protein YktA (UPF0223 family)
MDMRKRSTIDSTKRKKEVLKSRSSEKKRGGVFGVRSDVELSRFLKESGVPSLSKILEKVRKKQDAVPCH